MTSGDVLVNRVGLSAVKQISCCGICGRVYVTGIGLVGVSDYSDYTLSKEMASALVLAGVHKRSFVCIGCWDGP